MGRVYATTVSGRYGLMSAVSGMLLVLALSSLSFTQTVPGKIRGYKVYKKTIVVNAGTTDGPNDENRLADLKISDVGLADASLTGLTLDLSAAFRCPKQSGRVDFLTFRDFRVNGLRIDVEEYDHAFIVRKGEIKRLPQPIRVFVPSQRMLEAAWREFTGPKADWTITGRVYVFGKFRKFGFYFKRVVPVDVSVTIKNPLPSY